MESQKFIDVEKILKERAARLYRWLPPFSLRWVKRKLHEDDINFAMNSLQHYHGLEYNARILDHLGARVEALNAERVPITEPVTIAANHPLGGLDGMALIKAVGDIRSDVYFFVNDILKNLKNFGDVFVAVNKLGASSARHLRTMDEIFRRGGAVLIFPAGLVSRKIQGRVRDLSWKKSFITQAIDHKRLVQPVFIEGRNSSFFYNFANWRKRLGIRGNIEMLLLPDEMFRADKRTIRIHFGKPFSYKILDDSRSHKQWADKVYEYIYSQEFLQDVPFEEFIRIKG